MTKSRIAAVLVALAGLALAACQPEIETPAGALAIPKLEPQSRTLANGLRVYALPDASTASVSVAVWYDVGAKHDPAGRSGFAHLFEHMMFMATANMPVATLDRMTEDVGGFTNASTRDDYTNYYETVPANHLEPILWAEAERMGSLVVEQAVFDSERLVVIEEFREDVLASPYGRLFFLHAAQANFDVHPYGRPVIGSIEDLQTATMEDVKAFHAAYYRPDNAILVVAGNFDSKQLDEWVDKFFGSLSSPKRAIPRVTAVEPERTAPKSLTIHASNVPLPAVMISWPAPAADSPDVAAFMLLDAVLQRGFSSRLYQSLVYEQQLAAQVGSLFEIRQHPGAYALFAILSEGKSADDGVKALREQIAKIRDSVVSSAELDEARSELITEALQLRETSYGRAEELARSVIVYGDPAAADRNLASLQSVTTADVQRVAKSIMVDKRSVTIRYLSEAPGATGDVVANSKSVATAKIDIPAREIPTYTLAPEDRRQRAPEPGPTVAAKVPAATETTLANGLRVIVANRPELPLVAADLRISAGGALDPASRAGLATMTADVASRGTATRSATDVSHEVESLGALLTAGATADSSSLSVLSRADNAKEIFAVLADIAANPAFEDEEFERARRETLDGLTVAMGEPNSVGSFVLTRRLFGTGPYGNTPSPKSIAALKREDAARFHATWWRPDNAIFVITGDMTPAQGFALAAEAFAAWEKPVTPMTAPTLAGAATLSQPPLVIDMPKMGQAVVLMGLVGPSRVEADYLPALVINNVLGGGFSARLNAEIRMKRGLSYGAFSGLESRKLGAPIVASAQTRNDAVTQVVELMAGEMSRLGAQPIPTAELNSRKAALIGDFGRIVETTGGLAGQLSMLAQFGLPLDKLQTYAAEIEAVTPEQVAAAAKDIFDPATASLVVVGDAAQFYEKLKMKYPTLERIAIDALDLDSPTLE